MALQELQHGLGYNAVAHLDMIPHNNNSDNGHRYEVPRLSYEDIKQIMEHRLVQQKPGILTKNKINRIVGDWEDPKGEEDLDKAAITREVTRLEKKSKRYSVSELDSMPPEKQESRYIMLYFQLTNVSTKDAGVVNISAVKVVNEKHSIDIDVAAKIGYSWGA